MIKQLLSRYKSLFCFFSTNRLQFDYNCANIPAYRVRVLTANSTRFLTSCISSVSSGNQQYNCRCTRGRWFRCSTGLRLMDDPFACRTEWGRSFLSRDKKGPSPFCPCLSPNQRVTPGKARGRYGCRGVKIPGQARNDEPVMLVKPVWDEPVMLVKAVGDEADCEVC